MQAPPSDPLEFLAGVKVLKSPFYSPDPSPSDFWLFPKLKEPLCGVNLETKEELIAGVRNSRN